MDKELIDLFAQKNNMSFNTKKIDKFINEHFARLSGIANELTYDLDSASTHNLPYLPYEILDTICSCLKLSDIKPSPGSADAHTSALLGIEGSIEDTHL